MWGGGGRCEGVSVCGGGGGVRGGGVRVCGGGRCEGVSVCVVRTRHLHDELPEGCGLYPQHISGGVPQGITPLGTLHDCQGNIPAQKRVLLYQRERIGGMEGGIHSLVSVLNGQVECVEASVVHGLQVCPELQQSDYHTEMALPRCQVQRSDLALVCGVHLCLVVH